MSAAQFPCTIVRVQCTCTETELPLADLSQMHIIAHIYIFCTSLNLCAALWYVDLHYEAMSCFQSGRVSNDAELVHSTWCTGLCTSLQKFTPTLRQECRAERRRGEETHLGSSPRWKKTPKKGLWVEVSHLSYNRRSLVGNYRLRCVRRCARQLIEAAFPLRPIAQSKYWMC